MVYCSSKLNRSLVYRGGCYFAKIDIQWRPILNDQGSIICHKSGHNWASYRPLVFFFFITHLGYVLVLPGGLLFIFFQEIAVRGRHNTFPPKWVVSNIFNSNPFYTHLLRGALGPRYVLQRPPESWGESQHTQVGIYSVYRPEKQ